MSANASQSPSKMLPHQEAEQRSNTNALQMIMAMGGENYIHSHPDLTNEQVDLIRCMSRCKTGKLGYTYYHCDGCNTISRFGRACHNSQCSNCQSSEADIFTEENMGYLVDAPYFHIVFTLPDELIPLIKMNKRFFYDLIIKAASQTILDLSEDKKFLGGKPGIVMVLQTFGSALNYRLHVHTIVAGAALNKDRTKILKAHISESSKKAFFIPEAVMEPVYRAKFVAAMQDAWKKDKLRLPDDLQTLHDWQIFKDRLFSKQWIIYSKETFKNNGNALKYVSRYVGRIAIGNGRILSFDENHVSFRYKDYKDDNKLKVKTVSLQDFIGLYIQHVLPRGFKKVRYFGFLWPSARAKNLAIFKKLQGRQVYEPRFTRDTDKGQISKILFGHTGPRCPYCGEYKLEYRVTTNSSGKIVFPLQAALNAECYNFENLDDRQRSKVIQYKEIAENHGYYHQVSLFPKPAQQWEDPNDPENKRQELDLMRRTYLTPESLGVYH